MEAAHDPLRAEQHGKRTGSARGFGVHGRDAVQGGVDFRHESTEMELLGELAAVEISHRRGLDMRRIDLRILQRRLAAFDDEVPESFAFFLEVALKVGAAAAEDVN